MKKSDALVEEMQAVEGADAGVGAEPAPLSTHMESFTIGGGLEAAEAHLAKFDEDVSLLWTVRGPKNKRIDSIGMFLVTPKGQPPAKLLALSMKSGAYQFYAPAEIAMPQAEGGE